MLKIIKFLLHFSFYYQYNISVHKFWDIWTDTGKYLGLKYSFPFALQKNNFPLNLHMYFKQKSQNMHHLSIKVLRKVKRFNIYCLDNPNLQLNYPPITIN